MSQRTLNRLFVANRGEIACRIIATCSRLGITSILPVTPVDNRGRSSRWADEVIQLTNDRSYLDAKELVNTAKACKADAIHPGYGFLSESPEFAQEVVAAGLIWIGPNPQAINELGNKKLARLHATALGVPVVPGIMVDLSTKGHALDLTSEIRTRIEHEIGFPLIIKSALGGGGRGMRIVTSSSDLPSLLIASSREAKQHFGGGDVFCERLVYPARHIEVQIAADMQGNVAVIGDRDCSMQRSHQKIIEECPAPDLSPKLRDNIHNSARLLIQNTGYHGVATVEFLLDTLHNWYFLEVNTRLQVEHPVTEEVYGIDLVELQLAIAQGRDLASVPWHHHPRGHAIECRLCAEKISDSITPSSGVLTLFTKPPKSSESPLSATCTGLRIETGYDQGDLIPDCYDSLICKIISHSATRQGAIKELSRGLRDIQIAGVDTNLGFLEQLITSREFLDIRHHITFACSLLPSKDSALTLAYKRAVLSALTELIPLVDLEHPVGAFPVWQARSAFQLLGNRELKRTVAMEQMSFLVTLSWETKCLSAQVQRVNAAAHESDVRMFKVPLPIVQGKALELSGELGHGVLRKLSSQWMAFGCSSWEVAIGSPLLRRDENNEESKSRYIVLSPLPGRIVDIKVQLGGIVEEGDALLTLESMKMEHIIRAPCSGIVHQCQVTRDSTVKKGAVLLEIR